MKNPNFFIIGAPKCGTTSLAAWLAEHPDIYMSPIKEPHFFDTDLVKRVPFTSRKYQGLFTRADARHTAVGEASTWYLYSEIAIQNILQYAPEAKFIAMLRNPVDMAYALHAEQYYSGNEGVEDFREAWSSQVDRENNRNLPSGCFEPKKVLYGRACMLGYQVKRLLTLVPREKVHFILLDDIKRDTYREYLQTLNFLNVSDDGRTEFPVKNPAKQQRSPFMQKLLRHGSDLKKTIGIYRNFGLNTLNLKPVKRPPLDATFRAEMLDYFRNDILLLEKILDRDLSAWRR